MIFWLDMPPRHFLRSARSSAFFCALIGGVALVGACKRSEPQPDLLKTQRDAMERAKEVGQTMQKGVDAEGKKADEEGK